MRRNRFLLAVGAVLMAATALTGCSTGSASTSASADAKTINIAAPQCAHCLAMYLLPDKIPGYTVNVDTFKDFSSLLAGLASGQVDVAQIDYTGLISMIDGGADVVAISGQVNGGTDFVIAPSLGLTADDWAGFASLAQQKKASGTPLKIASQFGTVQDIELRLQLPAKGISNDDVEYVNVPYEGMSQALSQGAVDAAIPVQPVAATITNAGIAEHFAFPYDQPASDLTNVVVANRKYADSHPEIMTAIAGGLNTLVDYLPTAEGQKAWSDVIQQKTGASAQDTATAISQLTPALDMPFSQIVAVAQAMYDQHLIKHDFTAADLEKYVDYTPLATATGKTPAELGDSE